jgi:hypothetical protein
MAHRLWYAWPVPRTLPDSTPDFDSEDLLEEPLSDSAIELRMSDLGARVSTPLLGCLPCRWSIHRVVIENDGCRSKTYMGSVTDNDIAPRKYPFDHPFASVNN